MIYKARTMQKPPAVDPIALLKDLHAWFTVYDPSPYTKPIGAKVAAARAALAGALANVEHTNASVRWDRWQTVAQTGYLREQLITDPPVVARPRGRPPGTGWRQQLAAKRPWAEGALRGGKRISRTAHRGKRAAPVPPSKPAPKRAAK